jgi:hypothetical protein
MFSDKKFPEGTQFALYAGLPLNKNKEGCFIWDRSGGRPFYDELFSLGKACSEADFRQAIENWKNGGSYRWKSAEGMPIVLPTVFESGTKFADYEDVPVTETDWIATAWDRPGGRPFSSADFFHKASPCSEKVFRELVVAIQAGRK